MTRKVGGSLVEEEAGLSAKVNEGDEHRGLLLHLWPRPVFWSIFQNYSSTGPSAGLRGFIFEILARQRARDSCEVTVAVRKGEAREQVEEEEVEKARQKDSEEEKEEEELMRTPSPIATPTLCIFSFLESLNIISHSILVVVGPLICLDPVPTSK